MKDNAIFVFGSNEAGIHGAGAAAHAYKGLGARWGQSYGHVGQTFAIPTKGYIWDPNDYTDKQKMLVGGTLSLAQINRYVQGFLAYAEGHPELDFKVTRLGCGLAGLHDKDIASMFRGWEHTGMYFDEAWKPYLQKHAKFWGTF